MVTAAAHTLIRDGVPRARIHHDPLDTPVLNTPLAPRTAPLGERTAVTTSPALSGRARPSGHLATQERADSFYSRQVHHALTRPMQDFIGRQSMMFLSTADQAGHCDATFRAGPPGFVTVLDDFTLHAPRNIAATGSLPVLAISPAEPPRRPALHGLHPPSHRPARQRDSRPGGPEHPPRGAPPHPHHPAGPHARAMGPHHGAGGLRPLLKDRTWNPAYVPGVATRTTAPRTATTPSPPPYALPPETPYTREPPRYHDNADETGQEVPLR